MLTLRKGEENVVTEGQLKQRHPLTRTNTLSEAAFFIQTPTSTPQFISQQALLHWLKMFITAVFKQFQTPLQPLNSLLF